MARPKKFIKKKSVYETRRYWYHLSTTLGYKQLLLMPGDTSKGFNRDLTEPDIKRICVAPSIAQCLTALPYSYGDTFMIYRTKNKIKVERPVKVFDASITHEGWITKPTVFIKIGKLALREIDDMENLPGERASHGKIQYSKQNLARWKKKNLWKYIKRPKKRLKLVRKVV